MSWASSRHTTLEEDMACCLLDIFEVNIPLIYGEGAMTFQRLHCEILAATEDYTLLLWGLWVPERLTFLDAVDWTDLDYDADFLQRLPNNQGPDQLHSHQRHPLVAV
ncbi:hypothetical protein QBC36DRAFT_76464 [Triangularia setosa]|uniref:Uncharacterized protein n=1 Tax=Triangularia setosa TaxID=2587417 RepID=A0AAN7A3V8_9PEZI|nr:hypothetical protein QBC36DRAFT_76464 [Podospora setosa]